MGGPEAALGDDCLGPLAGGDTTWRGAMSGSWRSAARGEGSPAAAVDTKVASVARMYDYFLGGKDNFGVDRERGDAVIARFPDTKRVARQNRALIHRAVPIMVERGVHQFIDLGSGLPTQQNVHEVAQYVHPDVRVVYVDNDPIVLSHGRAMFVTDGRTAVIDADLREPQSVLRHPELRSRIDFSQPVGVLFVAVLHFVPDDSNPPALIRAFRERMAPRSHLLISHVSDEGVDPDAIAGAVGDYDATTSPLTVRSSEEIRGLFEGFTFLEPGLAPTWLWRPPHDDPAFDGKATQPPILAGLGELL